jgi:hypothetical protein
MPNALEELRQFHRFVTERLNGEAGPLSPEEALDEWRRQNPSPEASEEDVAAIQEALDDLANREQPMRYEDFDRAFRERHDLLVQSAS